MPFFPAFPDDAGVATIYKAHPQIYRPWIRMGEEVMTKDSPLSQGERELIATYVSSLNDCDYCRTTHLPSMQAHGIEQSVVDALLADIDSAPVEHRLKPIFAFARKLTLSPAQMSRADADAVYDAGWDEDALHAVICVVCRFNFMNRLVMGHGLIAPDSATARENARQRQEKGYAGMHPQLAGDKEAG